MLEYCSMFALWDFRVDNFMCYKVAEVFFFKMLKKSPQIKVGGQFVVIVAEGERLKLKQSFPNCN